MSKIIHSMNFVEELKWRGMVHTMMPGTEELLEKEMVTAYVGIDPTADSLHIGHLCGIMMLRHLQRCGHKPLALIGGATGMIGDPTGKSKTRKQLTPEQVEANAKTYTEQIFKILDKDKTEVVFNSSWFEKMNFRDVINLCAKATVARILERDEFQKRYNAKQPIAVHEFFYPLMQAYDSVMVKADIELGGTDQVFNILMGRNIQKDYGMDPQITLFMPLLEGLDGVDKMSKSLGNGCAAVYGCMRSYGCNGSLSCIYR